MWLALRGEVAYIEGDGVLMICDGKGFRMYAPSGTRNLAVICADTSGVVLDFGPGKWKLGDIFIADAAVGFRLQDGVAVREVE